MKNKLQPVAWRSSFHILFLRLAVCGLALIYGLQLAACAPAATPMPVTAAAPAAVSTSAPAATGSGAATQSAAPTEAPLIIKTATPEPTGAPTSAPTIQETRLLTLDFPPAIRAGDSDVVRLTLEMDESGNLVPTVSQAGNVTKGEIVHVPNVYDSYNVLAEARLEMAGVDVRPNETVSEALTPGQKITFYWSVLPNDVGVYKGIVWFYLHFIPKVPGVNSATESRKLLWTQEIQIEATSFLGIRANPARWLGLTGTVVSSVLGLPFLESILKYVWKKLRRSKSGPAADKKKPAPEG